MKYKGKVMKKIVWLSIVALCFPLVGAAQSYDDDLYYTPKKNNSSQKKEEQPVKRVTEQRTTTTYVSPGATTVVIKDRKGRTRDVDEYNRRYSSKENSFEMDNDTLYIKEKAVPDLDGEWTNDFQGSRDDYEYAERIIRFRNPRYAIPVSSPLYWDVVYGLNSWDWNVYSDGLYAYAFPTFTNRLWWDWRFGSFGIGWGWGSPGYYGWNSPYWGPGWGWGSGFGWGWTSGWHHHGWYDPWYGGGGHWHGGNHWANNNVYYNNRRPLSDRSYSASRGSSSYNNNRAGTGSVVRRGSSTGSRSDYNSSTIRRGSSTGRVVGTRNPSGSYDRPSGTTRPSLDGSSVSGSSTIRQIGRAHV